MQLEWTSLGVKDLNTTAHQQVAYDAALQSLVLLKNGNAGRSGTEIDHAPTAAPAATSAAEALPLPLARGKSLAVVGPLAFETDGLVSDYAKWHMNDASPASQMSEPPSIAEALARANVGGNTVAEIGVQVSDNSTSGIAAALAAVSKADAVVIVLGMTRTQEHEAMYVARSFYSVILLAFLVFGCVCVCVCVCVFFLLLIYIYIYIYIRESERTG